jgi:hypothetical protein
MGNWLGDAGSQLMNHDLNDVRTMLRETRKFLSSQVAPTGQYVSRAIPGIQRARLAMSSSSLALIINYVPQGKKYDRNLKNLSIQFDRRISIINDQGSTTERVAILETKGLEISLQEAFIEVISMILPSFENATDSEVMRLINNLVEVFQLLGSPSKKSVLGLWGELFAIWRSTDLENTTKAWHSSTTDRYDFGDAQQRVEVKTTTGPRSHFFSYEQLNPSPHIEVFVCSIITEADDSNTSCSFLLSEIAKLLQSPVTKQHLLKTAIATLGSNWPLESVISFDLNSAIQSTRWYKTENIPRVDSLPVGVSQVKFKSDLQDSPDTPIESLALNSGLIRAFSSSNSRPL